VEYPNDLVDHELRRLGRSGEQVEADRPGVVGWIKHDNVLGATGRDTFEHVTDQVALGVEHDHTTSGRHVLTNEAEQERRLA